MQFTLSTSVLISALMLQCQSQSSPDAKNGIIYYTNEVNVDSYKFEYKSEDGTYRKEYGRFENGVWTVTGEVDWRSSPEDDMPFYQIYQADEHGYRYYIIRGCSLCSVTLPQLPLPLISGLVGGALKSNYNPSKSSKSPKSSVNKSA